MGTRIVKRHSFLELTKGHKFNDSVSHEQDPIADLIIQQLDQCIQENPVEYNRYNGIIADEYFFIVMKSSIPHEKKIELLENHLSKWGPDTITAIKPLVWNY